MQMNGMAVVSVAALVDMLSSLPAILQ